MAEPKARKPRARHRDIVIGALEERIRVQFEDDPHGVPPNGVRMMELLDELKRSLNGKSDGDVE